MSIPNGRKPVNISSQINFQLVSLKGSFGQSVSLSVCLLCFWRKLLSTYPSPFLTVSCSYLLTQEWPQTSATPASISRMLGLRYVISGIKPGALWMLCRHSTNWTLSYPLLIHVVKVILPRFWQVVWSGLNNLIPTAQRRVTQATLVKVYFKLGGFKSSIEGSQFYQLENETKARKSSFRNTS